MYPVAGKDKAARKWAEDAIACKKKGTTPPPLPKGCFGGRTFIILVLLGPLGEKEQFLSIASGVLGKHTTPTVPLMHCTVPPRPVAVPYPVPYRPAVPSRPAAVPYPNRTVP